MNDNAAFKPLTRVQLFARLNELGIVTRTVEHPPLFTVAQSAEVERQLPGGHTKNLFLKDAKANLYLVVALTTTSVDLKTLPQTISSHRLSFGKTRSADAGTRGTARLSHGVQRYQ